MLRSAVGPSSLCRLAAATAAPLASHRSCSSGGAAAAVDVDKRLEEVNMQFGEARELIADAKESIGTTDYSDDAEDAVQATKAALALYQAVLADLTAAGRDADRTRLERENGQKMKQLEIELQAVLEHDH
jgi:predicted TIM-barrel enzyme